MVLGVGAIRSLSSSTDSHDASPPAGQLKTLLEDGLPGPKKNLSSITGRNEARDHIMTSVDGELEARPPYLHAIVAGGLGGSFGDMLMHSLDTVKTRQQGDPHIPPKYTTLRSSFFTILRQEGIARGLYSGWAPALLGSIPGTAIFFGVYEFSKRRLIDNGVQPHLAYMTSGFLGDLTASVVYVPSEVLKTRLQLQGRYRNPFFQSGFNYRGTADAARTIVRYEGVSALFHGYKATLYRDLPFSALQFTFYEQALSWARQWKRRRDIGWQLELLTGAVAGGLAGTITCPLDVVKTRLQTQLHPFARSFSDPGAEAGLATAAPKAETHRPVELSKQVVQKRMISTSSPSTHTPRPGALCLDTTSVYTGLKIIYEREGMAGLFRGVGPRVVWTSIQSGCMLFLYQGILRQLELHWPVEEPLA